MLCEKFFLYSLSSVGGRTERRRKAKNDMKIKVKKSDRPKRVIVRRSPTEASRITPLPFLGLGLLVGAFITLDVELGLIASGVIVFAYVRDREFRRMFR